MEAFRRPEIAEKKVAVIEHDSLQHDGRIDHPDFQRVIAGEEIERGTATFLTPSLTACAQSLSVLCSSASTIVREPSSTETRSAGHGLEQN